MSGEKAELVDTIAWSRARSATALAVFFVVTQATSLREEPLHNLPATIHFVAWVFWALMLLFFLTYYGFRRPPDIRAQLNDETTRDHRQRAFVLGFWAALGAAVLVYAATVLDPTITAREGMRLVVTAAIAVALLRFGALERRALADG